MTPQSHLLPAGSSSHAPCTGACNVLRLANTLVATYRNAVDWAASLFKQPYYGARSPNPARFSAAAPGGSPAHARAGRTAPGHCNVTFAEFLAAPWRPAAPLFDDPCQADMRTYCPKTQSSHQEYEQRAGEFADSVMEMRAWKLARIRKLCNTRRQAACVRYEDLMADPRAFLDRVRQRFHVDEQPGYFQPVSARAIARGAVLWWLRRAADTNE